MCRNPNSTVEGAKHFKKGVTKEYQSKDLTKAQKKQIAILDAYGKAHGISFVMVDTIEDGRANGTIRTVSFVLPWTRRNKAIW